MHSFLKEIGEKYSIHQRIRILERMHLIIPHLYRFGEFKTWMHYFILVDFLKKRNAYRPRERPEYSKTQGKVYILSVDLVTDDCRSFTDWSGLPTREDCGISMKMNQFKTIFVFQALNSMIITLKITRQFDKKQIPLM